MQPADFDYELPDELIARYPPERRSDSRLLRVRRGADAFSHHRFGDLPDLLRPGDLVVVNDTRVIAARALGRKETGGRVEMLLERVTGECRAQVHLKAGKPPRAGTAIEFDPDLTATVLGRVGELYELEFNREPGAWLDAHGKVPLPPYLGRDAESGDKERYQTVYAREPGAVAAPTAGLHFDDPLIAELTQRGIGFAALTLHVGAGTFQNLRAEQLESGRLHEERCQVDADLCSRVAAAKATGGRVVAVGTTSARALEAAAALGELAPFDGETDLFIRPGYEFRVVDALITNFHLPRSSLLMMVSALAGRRTVLDAYRAAVAARYRFFSYGDAMLIEAEREP